jgi:hypothetical protein
MDRDSALKLAARWAGTVYNNRNGHPTDFIFTADQVVALAEALGGAPQAQPGTLTTGQIERHTLRAGDCPANTEVLLASSVRKLLALDAPQAQPNDYRDAYEGAREDLLDWKRRALEAEAKLRDTSQYPDDRVEAAIAILAGAPQGWEGFLAWWESLPSDAFGGSIEALARAAFKAGAATRKESHEH